MLCCVCVFGCVRSLCERVRALTSFHFLEQLLPCFFFLFFFFLGGGGSLVSQGATLKEQLGESSETILKLKEDVRACYSHP